MSLRAAAALLLAVLQGDPSFGRDERVVAAFLAAETPDPRRELHEMARAAVDAALLVSRSGSVPAAVVEALEGLEKDRKDLPRLGLYYDTTALKDVDLTRPEGRLAFAEPVRRFLSSLPPKFLARADRRPVVWIGPAPASAKHDRASWSALAELLGKDAAYWIVEDSWAGAPADRTYSAAAGPVPQDRTAIVVGPGREREEGRAYEKAWVVAIRSAPRWIAIGSWGDVCECAAHGKRYAELSRRYARSFKLGDTVSMPAGKWTGAAKVVYTLEYNPNDQGLRPVKTEEGPFETVAMGGLKVLTTKDPGKGGRRSVGFDVDDSYCFFEKRSCRVTVEFLDTGEGSFALEYDSVDPKLSREERRRKNAGEKRFTGTGEWRRETFDLPDAIFSNAQSGGTDFRLVVDRRGLAIRLVAVQ